DALMFLARRPSAADIDRFLQASRDLPLSYAPPGILLTDSTRGRRDEVVAVIGQGEDDFARARPPLEASPHFALACLELFPDPAPLEGGTVVAVLIRPLGLWSLNGCRIISTSKDAGPRSRLRQDCGKQARGLACDGDDVATDGSTQFGFTYGTLPNHCEAGEE